MLSANEKAQLAAALSPDPSEARRRAQVLRSVAEDADLRLAEFNRAFALMQYYGYLRRNPDDPQDTDFRDVVKSGTLTVEDGCGGDQETLTPGQAFEEMDGRVHRARNLSATEDVVVYNTFIVPQGKPTTRNIPNNQQRCGPPIDVDECKDEGWLKFNHPQSFFSQGQCIDFVKHRPRNVIPVPEDPLGQN